MRCLDICRPYQTPRKIDFNFLLGSLHSWRPFLPWKLPLLHYLFGIHNVRVLFEEQSWLFQRSPKGKTVRFTGQGGSRCLGMCPERVDGIRQELRSFHEAVRTCHETCAKDYAKSSFMNNKMCLPAPAASIVESVLIVAVFPFVFLLITFQVTSCFHPYIQRHRRLSPTAYLWASWEKLNISHISIISSLQRKNLCVKNSHKPLSTFYPRLLAKILCQYPRGYFSTKVWYPESR